MNMARLLAILAFWSVIFLTFEHILRKSHEIFVMRKESKLFSIDSIQMNERGKTGIQRFCFLIHFV